MYNSLFFSRCNARAYLIVYFDTPKKTTKPFLKNKALREKKWFFYGGACPFRPGLQLNIDVQIFLDLFYDLKLFHHIRDLSAMSFGGGHQYL